MYAVHDMHIRAKIDKWRQTVLLSAGTTNQLTGHRHNPRPNGTDSEFCITNDSTRLSSTRLIKAIQASSQKTSGITSWPKVCSKTCAAKLVYQCERITQLPRVECVPSTTSHNRVPVMDLHEQLVDSLECCRVLKQSWKDLPLQTMGHAC
jgi:hypothetical protein